LVILGEHGILLILGKTPKTEWVKHGFNVIITMGYYPLHGHQKDIKSNEIFGFWVLTIPKFSPWYVGPFQVLKQVNPLA